MSGESVNCVFLSQHISRIKWRPTVSSLEKSKMFATGSSGEAENTVSIWDISQMKNPYVVEDYNPSNDEGYFEQKYPKKVSSLEVGADVSALSYVKSEGVVIGNTAGLIKYLSISPTQKLSESFVWEGLHSSKMGGCSGLDVNLPDIATVGDDGSIHILHVTTAKPLHSLPGVDSCAITCVRWLSSSELSTTNSIGQLRIYDVRSPNCDDKPQRVIMSTVDPQTLRSLDRHPSQAHMLAAGGADGCLTFFDLRQDKAAIAKLQLHQSDVWDVRFNQQQPDLLYTCSEDGSVRKLDTSSNIKHLNASPSATTSPIQISEMVEGEVAVNAIDVSGSSLVCANDSDAIYLLQDEPVL